MLVVEFFESVELWVAESFLVAFAVFELALLLVDEFIEALVVPFECDSISLFVEPELAVAFAVVESFLVELLADPLSEVLRLLAAVPLLVVAVAPLEELLLFVELATFEDLPPVPDAAVFAVEPELAVLLPVVALVFVAFSVSVEVLVVVALLVAVVVSIAFLLAVEALVELLVTTLVAVLEEVLLAEWFNAALRLLVLLLLVVSSDIELELDWLFAPRL